MRMFMYGAGIIFALAGIALYDTLTTTNGNKCVGTVTQVEDTYFLIKFDGSTMTFRRSEVLTVQKSTTKPAGSAAGTSVSTDYQERVRRMRTA